MATFAIPRRSSRQNRSQARVGVPVPGSDGVAGGAFGIPRQPVGGPPWWDGCPVRVSHLNGEYVSFKGWISAFCAAEKTVRNPGSMVADGEEVGVNSGEGLVTATGSLNRPSGFPVLRDDYGWGSILGEAAEVFVEAVVAPREAVA